MIIIPIAPVTLELIEELNNGVRPIVTQKESFFIWNGKDGIPEIIYREALEARDEWCTIVKILAKN